jgi:apolipoprotein N-acyltransferase
LGLVFNEITHEEIEGETSYFNSALFLDRKGNVRGRYDKIHLVPFGEYIPWRDLFFFAETITKDVGDFHPGADPKTVVLGEHPVNAIICFEAVFPELSAEFVRRGSQLFINITNDRWYGDSAAPYQHMAMARWRAVENRRYMLRAANSGISVIVEPTGEIQNSTNLLQEAHLEGDFMFLETMSFYSRHGDLLAGLCVIIVICSLLIAVGKGTTISGNNEEHLVC